MNNARQYRNFNVRKLLLGSNKLMTLPESIGNLSSLQTLSLSDNKLTTLPESIKILERRGVHIYKWSWSY